jgi:hypothetical protein
VTERGRAARSKGLAINETAKAVFKRSGNRRVAGFATWAYFSETAAASLADHRNPDSEARWRSPASRIMDCAASFCANSMLLWSVARSASSRRDRCWTIAQRGVAYWRYLFLKVCAHLRRFSSVAERRPSKTAALHQRRCAVRGSQKNIALEKFARAGNGTHLGGPIVEPPRNGESRG